MAVSGSARAARVWEGTVQIPTYVIGAPDPDPPFALVTPRRVYPYPLLDNVTRRRELKSYRAIFLENSYLKATILPDVGGRLISLYDKIGHREVFYHNHVIKPLPAGVRGAWISGGLEFNFPDSHSTDTVSPVSYEISNRSDGSAAVSLGDLDQVTGMLWEEDLILRPQCARLELYVRLLNASPLPHLYWYWGVGAIYATQDLQLIFPMREANTDVGLFTYPVNRGVDWSWYKNAYEGNSLFACQVRRNFFGAYYHDSDHGIVHVADFRDLPGKKIWTWGHAQAGKVWESALTDNDGSYDEIQTGRTETQLKYEFIPPHRAESFREYWYPIRGLHGGFQQASSKLALNVTLHPASKGNQPHVTVLVFPTVPIEGAGVSVKLGSSELRQFASVVFTPGVTKTFVVPVANVFAAKHELVVEIASKDGRSLLHWSAAEPVDGNPDFSSRSCTLESPGSPSPKMTAQELYDLGVEKEKRYGLEAGSVGGECPIYEIYQQAVRRDPHFTPALLKLAWREYRGADFAGAQKLLASAGGQSDPYVDYTYGLIYRSLGRLDMAANYFWSSFHFGIPLPAAYVELGETLIQKCEYPAAIKWLNRALDHNSQDAMALTDLAAAFRLAGKQKEAAATIKRALTAMPLSPFVQAERSRIFGARGVASTPNTAHTKLLKAPYIHDYLQVAAWYRQLGDLPSSDAVLKAALAEYPPSEVSPLVYYYLASNAFEEGQGAEGTRFSEKAAQTPYQYVFPSRITDAQVLAEAVRRTPHDAHAKYFLGNFYFAHDRYDGAAALWREAEQEGFSYSVLQRNLGVYEWEVKGDLPKATAYYEKAIQLAPDQYRLYASLDDLYMAEDDMVRRERMFREAPRDVLEHDRLAIRLARLYIQQKRYDDALSLLLTHQFRPGHIINRQVYLCATIGKGIRNLRSGKPDLAVKDFSQAADYPVNLGVGKLAKPDDSEAYYWLGQAYRAAGNVSAAHKAWLTAVKEGSREQGIAGYNLEGIPTLFAALAQSQLGDVEQANKVIAGLAQVPKQRKATARELYVAGLAEHFLGHEPEARALLHQALQVDPLFWQAQIALSRDSN
ncbi:MAG: DUF5107 domain-containing protein [Acidobacteria bacterium]|nr:DUF5107 domain-containing protein [Acidobacteriota bacterium]